MSVPRRPLWILGVTCTLLVAPGCDAPRQLEISGTTMGTTYIVKVVNAPPSRDEDAQRDLRGRIEDVLQRVEGRMSTYRQDSEISRFNRSPVGEWFSVSTETQFVISHAQALAASTDGAFDVTVGLLVNLWGFGPTEVTESPSERALVKARERVGHDLLESRASPPALRKHAEIYVDLSAIAKGFGVDEVARLLEKVGIGRYLVEIGGELRVLGDNARGEPWRVGVQVPAPDEIGTARRTFALREGGVATSGDYRNFFARGGRRYSHTIDPRTGLPTSHALASVTVSAPTAMEADALATALYVLGPEQGTRYAAQHRIAALFIIRRGDGLKEISTPQFAELLDTDR